MIIIIIIIVYNNNNNDNDKAKIVIGAYLSRKKKCVIVPTMNRYLRNE